MIHPAIDLEKLTPEQRVDLGYMLEQGDDLFEQDYVLAAAAYTSAALKGSIIAMNNLGWLYHKGLGVDADLEKAKKYYRMAADAGDTTAMINLGNIGEESEDYKLTYKWYKKAYSLQEIMEDPLPVRENKKEFDELVLCDIRSESIDIHVRASLTNGTLTIFGHDLGPYVEKIWDHEDYEYWYSFDKENTEKLIASIHGEENPAAALFRKFSGEGGCSKLRNFCDRKKIEYGFFSYP